MINFMIQLLKTSKNKKHREEVLRGIQFAKDVEIHPMTESGSKKLYDITCEYESGLRIRYRLTVDSSNTLWHVYSSYRYGEYYGIL